jgi:hypothetical protein
MATMMASSSMEDGTPGKMNNGEELVIIEHVF